MNHQHSSHFVADDIHVLTYTWSKWQFLINALFELFQDRFRFRLGGTEQHLLIKMCVLAGESEVEFLCKENMWIKM